MQINMGGIMSKVRAYNKSAEGKERMTAYIDQCRSDGRGQTNGGSTIVTLDAMERAAEALIKCLRYEALECNPPLPDSVRAHFDSLDFSGPILYDAKKGTYVIYVYFVDDLHRDSLEREPDTSSGIRNIVALFNNGYNAENYVYGYWNGHKDIMGSSFHGWSTDTDAFIRSKISREGLGFIQQAVDDFNGNYGNMYQATAIPGNEYSPATWTLAQN